MALILTRTKEILQFDLDSSPFDAAHAQKTQHNGEIEVNTNSNVIKILFICIILQVLLGTNIMLDEKRCTNPITVFFKTLRSKCKGYR